MTEMTIIRDWQFYFRKSDGLDNMYNAISSFAPFWNEFDQPLFITNEKFIIGGKIAGKEVAFTPKVVSIERMNHKFDNSTAHDLMRATTTSEREFFFYSNEHTPEMFAAMNDMLQFHKLLKPSDLLIHSLTRDK